MMCSCGCGEVRMDQEQIDTLQELRNDASTWIGVDRGVSCVAQNQADGGAPHSFHLPTSKATDIYSNIPQEILFTHATKRFNGVGIYENGSVHVDVGVDPERRPTEPLFWYKMRQGAYVYFTDADECLRKFKIQIG